MTDPTTTMLLARTAATEGFKYYHYTPSMAAAVIFIILFLVTTLLHFYQMIRTRTWFFIPFVIGGIFEVIGYAGRAISSHQSPNWTLGPYIIQSLLLLVAPALFAASIYMCLGRIVLMVEGDSYLFVKRTWLTKVFVLGDVLSFMMQGAGGGLMASKTDSSINTGSHVVVGGLFIQVFFFGAFILAATIFHIRMDRAPTPKSQRLYVDTGISWQKHMFALYTGSFLILVRCIFRVIEYLQGFTGYLLEHEVYVYVFDATLMFLTMCVFIWRHPSEVRGGIKGGSCMRGVRMVEL